MSDSIRSPDSSSNADSEFDSKRFPALVKASFVALGADLFLIVLKVILAKLTGNSVLSADAWHSTGDLAVTFTVLLSIIANHEFKAKAWARNAEGLVALLISIVLILGGLNIIYGAIKYEPASFILKADIPAVIAIVGISIACWVSFFMFRFKRRIGRQYDSIAFTAEYAHTYSDFFTSLGVLVTLILGYFGIHVERYAALIVGLIVLRVGIRIHARSLEYFNISLKAEPETFRKIPGAAGELLSSAYNRVKSFIKDYKRLEIEIGGAFENRVMKSKRAIVVTQIAFVFILYAGTGFYTVLPYRTGIELLFGRVTELTSPGLHFHFPKPFGDLILADTGVVARVESGYRVIQNFEGTEPEAYLWEYMHQQGRYVKVPDEAITITGDENLVDVNFLCYYRIVDPVKYAFNSDDSHELFRSFFCHKIHEIMGRYHIDSLLTTGRLAIQQQLKSEMKSVAERISIGIEVLDVYMEQAHPPLDVVPQYRAVASARERRNEIIHKANAYRNDLLPRSAGRAKSIKLNAQTYLSEKTLKAEGEAESFTLKQRYFNRYRLSQKDRLWWETVERSLSGKSIYVLPGEGRRRVMLSDSNIGVLE